VLLRAARSSSLRSSAWIGFSSRFRRRRSWWVSKARQTLNRRAAASEEARDVFLCHAGEDKNEVARPLAEALRARGYSVWFDEFELALGDSLRRSIDGGLASSRFGLVVLSPSFFNKRWPQRELDGLTARETGDDLVILPIWHQVDEVEVRRHSPPLADRVAARTEEGIDALAERVAHAVNRRRGLAPSSTGSPTVSSPAVAPSGGIHPPATGQAEPPLPTEGEMLDGAIPPFGAPDHRVLYDGSLLLRLVARPAPADAQTPSGSEARALLDRATSHTLSHAEKSWRTSVRSGLLMQTLVTGWSAGEPRMWQAGRTTDDAEELAQRPTAAAVLRTRPLLLSVERTHPTRVAQRGGGLYHAGHDPWIVADSATVCALLGAYTQAISAVRFVDLLVQIGAAPTDQPLASAESYAPESEPFAEPDEGVCPTPPFAAHRYLGLARATPDELVDQPDPLNDLR